MPGARGLGREEVCSGAGIGKDKTNRGGGDAVRLSQRLSRMLVLLQKPLHTVRGRNDERYVIDRRDPSLVFRRFPPIARAIVSYRRIREEEEGWMRSATLSVLDWRYLRSDSRIRRKTLLAKHSGSD